LNDLLSAASLLLAVVGIFYGLWYPEIIKSLNKPVPLHDPDKDLPHKEISIVLFSKAVPLFISALFISFVFLPDTVKIFIDSLLTLITLGIVGYLASYDAVRTAFFLVEILAIAISIHSLTMVVRLISKRRKLTGKKVNKSKTR
jgi:hypothetical protein